MFHHHTMIRQSILPSQTMFPLNQPDSLQCQIENLIHWVAEYLDTLRILCSNGQRLATVFSSLLKGTTHWDSAVQFKQILTDINEAAQQVSSHVKSDIEGWLNKMDLSSSSTSSSQSPVPSQSDYCVQVLGKSFMALVQTQLQFFMVASELLSPLILQSHWTDSHQPDHGPGNTDQSVPSNSLPSSQDPSCSFEVAVESWRRAKMSTSHLFLSDNHTDIISRAANSTSDRKSAESISSALKIYVDNLNSLPSTEFVMCCGFHEKRETINSLLIGSCSEEAREFLCAPNKPYRSPSLQDDVSKLLIEIGAEQHNPASSEDLPQHNFKRKMDSMCLLTADMARQCECVLNSRELAETSLVHLSPSVSIKACNVAVLLMFGSDNMIHTRLNRRDEGMSGHVWTEGMNIVVQITSLWDLYIDHRLGSVKGSGVKVGAGESGDEVGLIETVYIARINAVKWMENKKQAYPTIHLKVVRPKAPEPAHISKPELLLFTPTLFTLLKPHMTLLRPFASFQWTLRKQLSRVNSSLISQFTHRLSITELYENIFHIKATKYCQSLVLRHCEGQLNPCHSGPGPPHHGTGASSKERAHSGERIVPHPRLTVTMAEEDSHQTPVDVDGQGKARGNIVSQEELQTLIDLMSGYRKPPQIRCEGLIDGAPNASANNMAAAAVPWGSDCSESVTRDYGDIKVGYDITRTNSWPISRVNDCSSCRQLFSGFSQEVPNYMTPSSHWPAGQYETNPSENMLSVPQFWPGYKAVSNETIASSCSGFMDSGGSSSDESSHSSATSTNGETPFSMGLSLSGTDLVAAVSSDRRDSGDIGNGLPSCLSPAVSPSSLSPFLPDHHLHQENSVWPSRMQLQVPNVTWGASNLDDPLSPNSPVWSRSSSGASSPSFLGIASPQMSRANTRPP